MLPGDGCVPRMSSPSARASVSTRVMIWIRLVAARGAGRSRREQVLGAHDLGDLAEHRGAAELDEPIGHASERRVRRQPGGVVGSAALQRQDQLGDVARTHAPAWRAPRPATARSGCPSRSRGRCRLPTGSRDLGRLAVPACRFGEALRDHLLAAERDDQHRADVRVRAVGRERVVRHVACPGPADRSRPGAAARRRPAPRRRDRARRRPTSR